ncbi:MAG: MEMAR_RS02690 family S-layer glycoprotein [Methanomicrobiales archaeon]|nr:MEMAR_RS02690 family S-layer glycoprotein [Methanomicrobiales archaeon]
MVVALMVLVAVSALASPVAARTAAKTIVNGDTIFVFENGLNITGVLPGQTIDELRYYADLSSQTPTNVIAVDNPSSFDVLSIDVGTDTGIYYAFNAEAGTINTSNYVRILRPSVTLGVVLNDSRVSSVDGQSISRNTDIAFKLTNNVGNAFPDGFKPNISIELTTPNGGKITRIGDTDLSRVLLTGSVVYAPVTNLEDLSAGTYTAIAKWPSTGVGSDFYMDGVDSNTVSFTLTTKAVSIESNKETVVRGNNFVTTISGESNHRYYVYVQGAGVADDAYPTIIAGQPGVNIVSPVGVTNAATAPNTFANVTTTAGGTRPIEWRTTTSTSDRTFTIRVVDAEAATSPADDTVRVRVEKGRVTITPEGTGAFYLGEEITLSGTNTESDTVYLFMTGPNLEPNGVPLTDISVASTTGNASTFTVDDVEADDTWEFKWNTGTIDGGLPDAGTYTIYAASAAVDKSDITDAQYAIASIQLRKGFVTATVSNQVVAQGDDLTITGTAEGKPDSLNIWIFGRNFRQLTTTDVEDDGTYEFELDTTDTMSTGQYFVVVQHPMGNGIPDITANFTTGNNVRAIFGNSNSAGTAPNFGPVFLSGLQASDAAQALIDALNSANVDDTYTRLTFLIEAPWITIDPVGDHQVGDTFTITGTTNLAEGDQLLVEIQSAAFSPTEKTVTDGFSGQTGTVEVQKGDAVNTWSFEVDASTFRPDQYIVTVESIEAAEASTSTTFNVVERTTTPTPTETTPVATTPPAETTTVPPTTTTPVPTQPGFGALIALVGLGAVAFLVLRRH